MAQATTIQPEFFFLVADESDIFYSPSTKSQNAKLEREAARAKFLVDLLENQGYEMRDIRLDFEGPKYQILGLADLVAFKSGRAFLVAQFLKDEPFLTEVALAREALWEKIKDLKAQRGVLIWGAKKETFSLVGGQVKRTGN